MNIAQISFHCYYASSPEGGSHVLVKKTKIQEPLKKTKAKIFWQKDHTFIATEKEGQREQKQLDQT